MSDPVTPRVNSARLGDFIGRTVRLTGKVLRFASDGNTGNVIATVEASDGGEVNVYVPFQNDVKDTYVEVIGLVQEAGVMKMHAVVNLGSELDLSLVNFVVEKWHAPQFASVTGISD